MLRKIKIERMANFIIFTKSVIVGLGNSEKWFTIKIQSYASFKVWFPAHRSHLITLFFADLFS
jgi:hypothetical protein